MTQLRREDGHWNLVIHNGPHVNQWERLRRDKVLMVLVVDSRYERLNQKLRRIKDPGGLLVFLDWLNNRAYWSHSPESSMHFSLLAIQGINSWMAENLIGRNKGLLHVATKLVKFIADKEIELSVARKREKLEDRIRWQLQNWKDD